MRYFIELAFKGTNYCGWQEQPNSVTVQSIINEKLSLLLRQKIETVGAGRTDTGVHALQFFAHFDTITQINDTQDIKNRLNKMLPYDISVFSIFEVNDTAHARFDAVSRTYLYIIETVKNPFNSELVSFINYQLNVDKMNEAAIILLSCSDFKSFCKTGSDNKTTICKVTKAEWRVEGSLIIFEITADRFLRNMVRAIVGTLIDVGSGKKTVIDFENIIKALDRGFAGQSAEAQGLYLARIEYKE